MGWNWGLNALLYFSGWLHKKGAIAFVEKYGRAISFGYYVLAFISYQYWWKVIAYPADHPGVLFDFVRLSARDIPLELFGKTIGFFCMVATAIVLALLTPVSFLIISTLLIASPLLILGAFVFQLLLSLGAIFLVCIAPLLLVASAKSVFINLALRAVAQSQKSDLEERAYKLATGGGAAVRSFDGKAVLMGSDEFDTLQHAQQRGASVNVGRVGGQPFSYATEKHLLVVASTRGGKGRDLIIPNLKDYPGSVFVLDPKGENAQETIYRRKEFGPVQVLDPFRVSGRAVARFNPLARLTGDMQVTDAQTLADALVEGNEDHWTSSARQLLVGLILHVVTFPDMPARDLPMVRRLLMRELPATLEAMSENEAAPEVVRDVGAWGLTAAPEEWASIVSNAIEQTKWLASPQIAEVLSDGGEQVDFAKYRDSVQSVFVCLPAPYFRTFNKWLRLVVAASLDTLTKQLNPDMPHPTRFVLDEVAQLGNLEKIESALTLSAAESGILAPEDVALMRGHGVHAFLVGEAFMKADEPGEKLRELFSL